MVVDIFEIGIERLKKEQAESEANNADGSQQTSEFKRILDVLICGSPKSGKSTFINRFLERTQNPDPTVGLCYKFATRTRVNAKELANLWELGNGGLMAHLITNCVNEKNIGNVSVILFLNLNEPQMFEAIVRPLLDAIKKQVDAAKAKASATSTAQYNNVPDGCFPIGISMAVIGSHYDEFQNLDTEKKRTIVRLLRFLAHLCGASLQMYSIYQEPLVSRGKTLLSQFGFDAAPNKTASLDIHKPVFVPACVDSLDEIGPLIDGRSKPLVGSFEEGMEQFYSALNELFKQEPDNQRTAVNTDDESKQFAEPLLDTAIQERYRELDFMIRDNRNRSQLQQ